MRITLFLLIVLLIASCTPKISAPYNNDQNSPSSNNVFKKMDFSTWYDGFLEEGETKKHSDYISIVSQKADGNYVKRIFFPDTKIMTHYNEFSDRTLSIKHGPEKVWSDLGVLTSEGHYSDGKQLGLFRNFEQVSGYLLGEGNYRDGKREGLWKVFDKNGNLKNERQYKKGMKQGFMVSYDEVGEIISKFEYRADTIYNYEILKKVEVTAPLNRTEQMPMYGDGCPELDDLKAKKMCSEQKMLRTIYRNLRYPPNARKYGLEGMAIARFVVDKSGGIRDVIVVRGLNQEISDEVARVVNLLDTWVPGMQDGEAKNVRYTIPIRFKLE